MKVKGRIFAVIFVFASVLALCASCGKQGQSQSAKAPEYAFVFDVKYVGGSDFWTEEKAVVEYESFRNNLADYANIVNKYNMGSEEEENTMKNMAHKCALTLAGMNCFQGSISLKKGNETLDSWDVGPR